MEVGRPDLWDDQELAKKINTEYAAVRDDVEPSTTPCRSSSTTSSCCTRWPARSTTSRRSPTSTLPSPSIGAALDELDLRSLFTGEHDEADCIVQINAKDGGVDAQDWSEILLRMYGRWAERRKFGFEVDGISEGTEAGILSAEFTVTGRYAYGLMTGERGTHRLVRISPFDNQGRRQTSFAAVQVWPVMDDPDVEVNEAEIRMEVFRASGAGGQHVNKTSSAVRLIHEPTGLVASSQEERSQLQNREKAMNRLKAMIAAKIEEEHQAELDRIAGRQAQVGWGSQIRSYVVQPYQMVKDLRTEVESSNVAGVLDGDVDEFMIGYLRWRRREASEQRRANRCRGSVRHGRTLPLGRRCVRRCTPAMRRPVSPLRRRPAGLSLLMITLNNVTKSYTTEVVALRDASFEVAKAEFVFLVGPSGSGKSTLLRLMNRQERPERGEVWVAGRNINDMPENKVPYLRRNIGNVFQDYKLLTNKTVFENVAFALEVIGRPRHVIRQQVPAVLELVNLDGKEERFPHQLSGGEQQRVSIARAFVNRPLILLADEPTGNLDPATGEGIMRLLDRINKTGTTVVMATHDQRIVNMMRKRVIQLDRGLIVRDQARGVYE